MKARSDLILRNLAGEYVLLPRGAAIKEFQANIVMNELSAFVWKRLQTPATRQELLSAILETYDIDEPTAAADLDALLTKFVELQLVEE